MQTRGQNLVHLWVTQALLFTGHARAGFTTYGTIHLVEGNALVEINQKELVCMMNKFLRLNRQIEVEDSKTHRSRKERLLSIVVLFVLVRVPLTMLTTYLGDPFNIRYVTWLMRNERLTARLRACAPISLSLGPFLTIKKRDRKSVV